MGKLIDALKRGLKEFFDDDCMSQAAAVAFYTIFSLPPLLVLVFFLAGLWNASEHTMNQLLKKQLGIPMAETFTEGIPSAKGAASDEVPAPGEQELNPLQSVAQRTGSEPGVLQQLGPLSKGLGVLLLVFTATGVFAQLQYALNRAWEVEPDPQQGGVRAFLLKRLLSLGMIVVIGFLLLVSLVLTTMVEEILRVIQGQSPDAVATMFATLLNHFAAFILATLLFAAMYLILPDAHMRWRDVWVGAAITAGLFVAGKAVIGWYLQYSHVGANWGSAAASMVGLLVWVYYSSLIVLFGAEMTQVWARRYGGGIQPARGAVRKVEEKRHIRTESTAPRA